MKLCFYLATKNKNKVIEVKDIIGDEIEVFLPPDFIEFPEEIGNTLEENAYIKALHLSKYIIDEYIVGEDSGLFVEKLNGLPGIISARFSGERNDKKNIEKLLKMMEKFKRKEDRKGKFITIACLLGKGEKRFFKGEIEGIITFQPRGTNGFGYDPVFEIPEIGKTFAELSLEEKNKISHRTKAFLKLKDYLINKHKTG
ncbi:MAG: RdgB/HAM1 family non-canonical purine NTP pyrophosphatase [Candidatus Omnitrophica bacterium]|nr:RdgB/HAM1 family non-canonical purine NTP pyrophosphatase [Candidatus Omnitrophota bacterium]MCM8810269.1 RdgB/HAM1 family non-canonical purine NTP pyrophosphatase [Candidatus Omnitrophota bacterium]